MSDLDRTDSLLRAGLRDLPAPAASSDFDAVVLAAVQRPPSRWQVLWDTARPVLGGAACSLVVMLALLNWVTQTPVTIQPITPTTSPAAVRPIDIAALERVLDRPGLTLGDFTRLQAGVELRSEPPAVKPAPSEPDRQREPSRRARLIRPHPILV
jgi:hypothetical protein